MQRYEEENGEEKLLVTFTMPNSGVANFQFKVQTTDKKATVALLEADKASVEAYWQHERGEKSMTEVLKELGISRNTFLKRVAEYIRTDAWVERIAKEDNEFGISNIAARIEAD